MKVLLTLATLVSSSMPQVRNRKVAELAKVRGNEAAARPAARAPER